MLFRFLYSNIPVKFTPVPNKLLFYNLIIFKIKILFYYWLFLLVQVQIHIRNRIIWKPALCDVWCNVHSNRVFIILFKAFLIVYLSMSWKLHFATCYNFPPPPLKKGTPFQQFLPRLGICSFAHRSFVHLAQIKRATVSDSLRSLKTN